MEYIAVGDKIVAEKIKPKTHGENGLAIPALQQQRFKEAIVLDVAPTFQTILKKGDIIRYTTTLFEYEDGVMILREDHVACVVKQD